MNRGLMLFGAAQQPLREGQVGAVIGAAPVWM